jgi:TRAP-type C4-dicarboxylate transport system substrate-binding protein
MRRKMWLSSVAVILCLVLLAGACATPPPAEEEEGPPPAEPEWVPEVPGMKPGEEDLYYEWTCPVKPTRANKAWAPFYWWIDEMEKRTNGHFKVKVVDPDQLGATLELPYLCGKGVFELIPSVQSYFPSQMPLQTALMLPMLGPAESVANILWNQYVAFHPLAQAELRIKFNLIDIFQVIYPPYYIFSKVPIQKVDDFKSLSMRATGGYGMWAKGLQATPVDLTIYEVYEAFQRNMIQVCVGGPNTALDFKWGEVCKYYIYTPESMGTTSMFYGANRDAWNALPQYIKDISAQLNKEAPQKWGPVAQDSTNEAVQGLKDKYGMEILSISKEEWDKIKAAAAPAYEAWYQDCVRLGVERDAKTYWRDIIAKRNELTGIPWTGWMPPE